MKDKNLVYNLVQKAGGSATLILSSKGGKATIELDWTAAMCRYQGVANINFRYERTFEYIYIQKTIRTNIRIYSYKKSDKNEPPNIFLKIFVYTNIFVSNLFMLGFRFDYRCWIFDV